MFRPILFVALFLFGFRALCNTPLLHGADSPRGSGEEPGDDWAYLDNGQLRIGVLRSSGAAIGFLAKSGSSRNLLNHFDRGRLVQQSFYGDGDGSDWNGKPWRYNPVQGGDWRGTGSRVTTFRRDGARLHAVTVPRHWATGVELPECAMEQSITLDGDVAHVRFRMIYRGTRVHAPHHQEIPAMFVEPSLRTLITCDPTAVPWTGAPLVRRVPGARNEYLKLVEHWAAYIDDNDYGVGIYVPAANEATCYRFTGAAGSDCSYVAPITTFALKPGTHFSYDAFLAVGTPAQLRERFAKLHRQFGARAHLAN